MATLPQVGAQLLDLPAPEAALVRELALNGSVQYQSLDDHITVELPNRERLPVGGAVVVAAQPLGYARLTERVTARPAHWVGKDVHADDATEVFVVGKEFVCGLSTVSGGGVVAT